MLRILLAAVLLAGTTSLYAQSAAAPSDADKAARRAQAREKFKQAREAAQKACEGKAGAEHRDCMTHEICSKASDPSRCEAREKAREQRRKERLQQKQSQDKK